MNHTLSHKSYKWGPQQLPINQEKDLFYLRNKSKPFWERNGKCYSNFHFNFYWFGKDRMDVMKNIPKEVIFCESNEVPRIESWKTQCDFTFVVSPHGNGMDCHEIWEALVLGCIVVVKKSDLDPLYNDLPVLIVKQWSDINEELLIKTTKDFKSRVFKYEKLSLEYWMNIIKSKMI